MKLFVCFLSLFLLCSIVCYAKSNKTKNSIVDNMLNRKSVRKYSDKKIEQEKIDIILKSAMSAPSAMNKQPWEILVITDKTKLAKIAEIAPNAGYSKDSQVTMIVCGDKNTSEKFWVQDCCAMTENILLAVESLELGAVWCAVYPFEDKIQGLQTLFNLPENIIPLNIIPIGYPLQKETPKQKYDSKKIHTNNWN